MDDTTLNSMARDIVVPEVQTLQKHLASANPHPQYITISELANAAKTRVCLSDIADVEIQPINIQDKALVCKNGTWQPVDITTLVQSQSVPIATTTSFGTVKLATDGDMDVAATATINTVITPNVLSTYVQNAVTGKISMATVSVPGIVTLATVADISNATTIENKAVTPYTLKQYIGGAISDATTTTKGVVTLATTADISNATAIENKAITPYVLKQYLTDNGIGASADVSYATSQTAGIIRIATSDDMFLPDGSTVITPTLLKEYKETYLVANDDYATTQSAGIVRIIDRENSDVVANLITNDTLSGNVLNKYVYSIPKNQYVNVCVASRTFTSGYHGIYNGNYQYYKTYAGIIAADSTAENMIANNTNYAVGYTVYQNGIISGRSNDLWNRVIINVQPHGVIYDVKDKGTVTIQQEANAKRVQVLPVQNNTQTGGGEWQVYGTVHDALISCTANQYARMTVCKQGHLEYAMVEGAGQLICGSPIYGENNSTIVDYSPGTVEHLVVHDTLSTGGLVINPKGKGYHITLNGNSADATIYGEAEDVTVYDKGVLHVLGSSASVKNLVLHSGATLFAASGAKLIGVTRYPGAVVMQDATTNITNMDNTVEPDKTIKYVHRMITFIDSNDSTITLIDKHNKYYFNNIVNNRTVSLTSCTGNNTNIVQANVYASIFISSDGVSDPTEVADLTTLLANFELYKPLLASTIDYNSALLGVRGLTQSALVRVNDVNDIQNMHIASSGNTLSALVFDGGSISDRVMVWATHTPAGVARYPQTDPATWVTSNSDDIRDEYRMRSDMCRFFSLSLYDVFSTADPTIKMYTMKVPENNDADLIPLTSQEIENGYINQRQIVEDVMSNVGNYGWKVIF